MKKQILKRDNFTCQKCNFKGDFDNLEIHHILPKINEGKNEEENLITLCSICHKYAPDKETEFEKYLNDKIDWRVLETFRKSNYSISKKTKKGMIKKISQGKHISKAPKGYKLVEKQLVPDENSGNIKKIFQEFLDSDISLTQLAKKFNMTPTGMKKLLRNTTYIGKVKFADQISDGQHKPLLNLELFNKVQDKIHRLGWS